MEFPDLGQHCSNSSCKQLGNIAGFFSQQWYVLNVVKSGLLWYYSVIKGSNALFSFIIAQNDDFDFCFDSEISTVE